MAMAYSPPAWVKSDSDTFKRWLSRKANLMISVTAREEALTGLRRPRMPSMKRCTGHGVHPFDAQEMDSELLGAYNIAQSKERRATQQARQFWFPLIQELPPVH